MDRRNRSSRQEPIDKSILALRHNQPRLMFSDLAKALPDYTWHMLFGSLGRLCKQQHVELLAHRWDYEVIFLEGTHNKPSASAPPEQCDQHDHDERAHL